MSFAAMEWCRPFKILGWPKAVLFCLADHHNEKTGRCDPSLITISRETGCSDQTARRAIQWLADNDFIVLIRRIGLPSLISLRFESVHPCHGDTPITQTPLSPSNEPLSPRQSTPITQIGTPIRVIPKSKEPRREPKEPMKGNKHVEANGGQGPSVGMGGDQASEPAPAVGGQLSLIGDGQAGCSCGDARDAWNTTAERCGWPRVQRFTPSRASALEARLAEIGGLAGWLIALGKMEASPFFRRRWTPVFDWILKPANLTKVMEGNYDDRAHETGLLATLAALREPSA